MSQTATDKPRRGSLPVPVETRFWSKVDLSDPNGCWPWKGSMRHRYGEVFVNGDKQYAHRVAFEMVFGFSPEAVCHRCDNPPCCRPDHLFAGTQADNSRDMWAKGRGSQPPHMVGEAHPAAKLTAEDVAQIRTLHAAGVSYRKLAARFGTKQQQHAADLSVQVLEIAAVNLDFDDQEWRLQAKCRGVDPELFYPERGASTAEAKQICFSCPVRLSCLDYAIEAGEKFGIFGGVSERGRRKLRMERYKQLGMNRQGRPGPYAEPLTPKVCANRRCENEFMPIRQRQVTCSPSCAASYRGQKVDTPWDYASAYKRAREGY